MSRTHTFRVTGMTCHACERFLKETLINVPGVRSVDVALKTSHLKIHMADGADVPHVGTLNRLIADRGYTLIPEQDHGVVCAVPHRDVLHTRLWRGVVAMGAVVVLALFLNPLRVLVPDISVGASIGAMIAFGAVASVSTCLASTGGFLLAVHGVAQTRRQKVLIHAGRLAAFIVGGAVLGLIGGSVPAFSESAYGAIALVLGIGFLIVGLHLMDLAPSPAQIGLTLPGSFWKWGDRIAASRSRVTPLLVGAVTFVLPCGFTQTAQALALASGSALTGALILGAFALGTLPVLAGISFSASGRGRASSLHGTLRLASGAILILFAVGQVDGGLTVLGSPVTPGTILASFGSQAVTATIPAANAQEQVINMTVAYGTYQPKQLTVRKGIPVRWEIDGKDIAGCASSLVVPTYGIKKNLVPGLNVIQFTPKKTGTIPFSCGMGMIRGSFTVIE